MTRYKGLRPGQLYLVYFNGLQLCEHVEQNCAYYSVPSYSHGGIFFIKLQRISLYKVLCYKIIADVDTGHVHSLQFWPGRPCQSGAGRST